jgi:GNAT superfamily N-acetyltransferase
MTNEDAVRIRAFRGSDRDQVQALAPGLTAGVAWWRDPGAVLAAVNGWIRTSLDGAGEPDRAVFVAELDGKVAGVVTVSKTTHFTGQADAYVGELVVAPGARRRGIATRLMGAAEAWAASLRLGFLTLETGAANREARSLYAALGYLEEDVRLAKALPRSADPD